MEEDTIDEVTKELNKYYEDHDSSLDDGLKTAAYKLLTQEDW